MLACLRLCSLRLAMLAVKQAKQLCQGLPRTPDRHPSDLQRHQDTLCLTVAKHQPVLLTAVLLTPCASLWQNINLSY